MGQKLVLVDIFYAPKHGKFCNDMNLPVFLKCSVKFISNLFDKFLEMVTKIQQIEITGWPAGPTFPNFLIQSPTFPYFLKKSPTIPTFWCVMLSN